MKHLVRAIGANEMEQVCRYCCIIHTCDGVTITQGYILTDREFVLVGVLSNDLA
jgi:hypothetical protein